ncbi:MAG: GTP cyclohydrolase I [Candidatus Eisenbacteria bacterium]|uniref:GTP cyclohydrolase I n=1 Tax=Eiseniibacteriota bacterium TaxID=2212470 RepID=A0A849T197_UNCEI|nr:GTP cyclohydrolase I [Candidatus Eisenbacteria bacterium]
MASTPSGFDRRAVERAIAELLTALGQHAADEPELAATPARVADLYEEVLAGNDRSAEPELVTFPRPGAERGSPADLVVVRDLPFHSLCVHHLVPFFGRAHIAYLPGERLIGISAAGRLLELYARRLQLQERLTSQVADHLERIVAPQGVAVVIEARHLCMEMRGIRKPGTVETRTLRGVLAEPRWAPFLPAPSMRDA